MSKDNDKELSDVKMKTTGLGAIMGHIQQNIETIEKETKPDPTSSVSIKLYTQFFQKQFEIVDFSMWSILHVMHDFKTIFFVK